MTVKKGEKGALRHIAKPTPTHAKPTPTPRAALKRYVCFLTPETGGTMTLRHDHGEVIQATSQEVAGQRALVADIPKTVPDGNGCWRDLAAGGYVPRSDHGVLRLTSINPVTESVAFESDTVTLDPVPVTPAPGPGPSPLPPRPAGETRTGIVHRDGRCWVDDGGHFYPLGATLFWAPYGWRNERERLQQNLEFLKGWDYVRILGEVGWPGRENDPTWPDYQQVMAELIDYAYDVCGLRTELTVTGGGPWNSVETAKKLAAIIPGREHKFMHFECANEAFKNCPDPNVIDQIGRILRQAAPQNLVALSAPEDGSCATAESRMNDANSNTVVLHLDRTYGDDGWRHVRQGWDFKESHFPCSSNEPIGPASSVASEEDPLRLAMSRATSIMCCAEAYVLHNGAGVSGVADPSRGRTANLWEMPGIVRIMQAVEGVTSVLPAGLGNFVAANDGWTPPNPVNPLHCTEYSGSLGPIKNYSAIQPGRQFVVMPHGIQTYYKAQATANITFTAYNPVTLEAVVKDMALNQGEAVTLPGAAGNRQCAYLIVGTYR